MGTRTLIEEYLAVLSGLYGSQSIPIEAGIRRNHQLHDDPNFPGTSSSLLREFLNCLARQLVSKASREVLALLVSRCNGVDSGPLFIIAGNANVEEKTQNHLTFVINSLKNIREKRKQDTTGSHRSSCRLEDTLIRKMLDFSWAKVRMKLSHKQVQHFLDSAGPQILNYENTRTGDDFDRLRIQAITHLITTLGVFQDFAHEQHLDRSLFKYLLKLFEFLSRYWQHDITSGGMNHLLEHWENVLEFTRAYYLLMFNVKTRFPLLHCLDFRPGGLARMIDKVLSPYQSCITIAAISHTHEGALNFLFEGTPQVRAVPSKSRSTSLDISPSHILSLLSTSNPHAPAGQCETLSEVVYQNLCSKLSVKLDSSRTRLTFTAVACHCEATLLAFLDNLPARLRLQTFHYLGISKLSCRTCQALINSYNETLLRATVRRMRMPVDNYGTHDKIYFPVFPPIFEDTRFQNDIENKLLAFLMSSVCTYVNDPARQAGHSDSTVQSAVNIEGTHLIHLQSSSRLAVLFRLIVASLIAATHYGTLAKHSPSAQP